MSYARFKSALRILFGVIGLLLLLVTGLLFTLRVTPIPLAPVALVFDATLSNVLGGQVDVENAQLAWSENEERVSVLVERINVVDRDGAAIKARSVSVGFSLDALLREQRFAVASIYIDEISLSPSRNATLPVAAGSLFAGDGGGGDISSLDYLEIIAVRDIVFDNNELSGDAYVPSRILLIREDGLLKGTANIAYRYDGKDTRLDAVASLAPGEKGVLDVTFERINPRDIGLFSRFLAPLQALQLPVSGDLHVDFDGAAQPQTGAFNLFVEPGALLLSEAVVPISELTLGLEADFKARRLRLADGRFNVAGVAGALNGDIDFITDDGLLRSLELSLDGQGLMIDRTDLFQRQLDIPRARAALSYDVGEALLSIERLTLTHSYGEAETSGQILLANNRPVFDFVTGFGSMSREAVSQLWPTPVAKRTRQWVDTNIVGGRLESGTLTLRATLDELVSRDRFTPIREEALRLDLQFDEVDIRFLAHLPPLQNTRAGMSLRGTSFRARAEGGTIDLPVSAAELTDTLQTRAMQVDNVELLLPNFRATGAPAEIEMRAKAEIADAMRALARPPINLARNVNFDFDRITGSADSVIKLNLPLIVPKGEPRPVQFQIDGVADGVDIAGKLGPYEIKNAQAHVDINNDRMVMRGRADANAVNAGFAWHQPLRPEQADQTKLGLAGRFTPQDLADLGQGWAGVRLKGESFINLLLEGPIAAPRGFRVHADLTEAEFAPRPLAYEKPAETPSYVEAAIKNNDGQIAQIRARLHIDGDEVLATQMNFDRGVLRKMTLTPFNLGKSKNVAMAIEPQDKGSFVSVTADMFDAEQLFDTFNTEVKLAKEPFAFLPFLGPDVVVEGRIGEVVGAYETRIEATRFRLFRKDGLHEEAWLEGVFDDGTDVLASIERSDAKTRAFSLQTENAGNLMRLFDWVEEFYGGALNVQGDMYDTGYDAAGKRKDLAGRMTLVSFRARNVGVLAQILTLASLTGIADTLGGDGIKFDKAKSNFSITDGRLNISQGQVNGPAIGLTAQGDFDMVNGDVDIGGTLVPAYSLNSFLGKIPLVGGILGSREGEGLIGIGYRVAGERGDIGVLVNPLSVLTPGVFRRIFEFGIGLPDRAPDPAPDVSAEPESGVDGVIE